MAKTVAYPVDLMGRYEFHNYGHAMEILCQSFPAHWEEIKLALSKLEITTNELVSAGGNETAMQLASAKGALLIGRRRND